MLLAFPVAIVVGIVNIVLFVLFMVLYSYVINPGHDEGFYQEEANRFGPISSIICGIPLMYVAGGWIAKRVGRDHAIPSAILVWLVYVVIDFAVVAAGGVLMNILPVFIISFATKFAAAYLGARRAISAA